MSFKNWSAGLKASDAEKTEKKLDEKPGAAPAVAAPGSHAPAAPKGPVAAPPANKP